MSTAALRLNGLLYPDGTNARSGVFNVKDPAYGAKGDGTTDDTVAIQAAATAACVNGGAIFFPVPGKYKITSQILIKSIYPVHLVSDMFGYSDNIQTGNFIMPGANFGANAMFRYEAPTGAGGHTGPHGAGLITGLCFYDPFNGTHTPNYTMLAALDLYDFNLGRVENCMFHVLNGGAVRSIFWIMGSMSNCVVRYCGTVTQAAVSLESASASVTAQSVTVHNCKMEVNYGTYLKLDSNTIQDKIGHIGFEADTSNALTCNTFIDNSGQQIQFHNIHINRNTVTQWVNQAASNFTIADNISIYGNSSLTVASMTISGSNHIFRGITIRNLTAQATQAISITGAFVDLSDVNIGNSGGIAASGNSYVSLKNILVNTPVAIASGAVIDASDQFTHIEGAIIVGVPANMNGIRLGGAGGANCRQSSVINNEVRDTSGTGVAFVNNDTNGSTVWMGNRAFSNTTDWSSTPASNGYVATGNLWSGASSLRTGTVTQATSITTGVTLNTASGIITTVSASTAAQATSTFTVTNSAVTALSAPTVTLGAYSGTFGTNGTPLVSVSAVGAGTFNVTIFNAHAANALAGTLKINYVVN